MSRLHTWETHSHNIHFKIMELVRSFLRRSSSSNRAHCCYIITSTEFKEKHTLEQNELFCCAIISTGLKGGKKKPFYVIKLKELKTVSFLLLKGSRPLLPWGPQAPYSSSGPLDSLSVYLRINSLKCAGPECGPNSPHTPTSTARLSAIVDQHPAPCTKGCLDSAAIV